MDYYMILPFCVARIRNAKGAILIGQTANIPRKPYPTNWDLPGGKLEDGETPEECMRREIQEELGVNVKSIHLADVFHHTTGTIRKDCTNNRRSLGLCYDVELEEGKIIPTEQKNVHFASPKELRTLKMTPWTQYFLRDLLH